MQKFQDRISIQKVNIYLTCVLAEEPELDGPDPLLLVDAHAAPQQANQETESSTDPPTQLTANLQNLANQTDAAQSSDQIMSQKSSFAREGSGNDSVKLNNSDAAVESADICDKSAELSLQSADQPRTAG